MSMTAGRRFLGQNGGGRSLRAKSETAFKSRSDTAVNSITSVL